MADDLILRLPGESEWLARERNRCALDPMYMGRQWFWPELFEFPSPQFHRVMIGHLMNLDIDKLNFKAPRDYAKCLSADTLVQTLSGKQVPISEVQVGQQILSYDEHTGQFLPDLIVAKHLSGLKPCLRIKTRSGKSIELTREHRVLTWNGWKKAGDLSLNDRIASPRMLDTISCTPRGDAEHPECALTRAKLRRMYPFEKPGEWAFYECAQVFWDQVVSVEEVGLRETIDVQVHHRQNLVTNLLVTHNSSIVTQVHGGFWHVFFEDRYRHISYLLYKRAGRKPKPWMDRLYRPDHKYVCIISESKDQAQDLFDGIKEVYSDSEGFRKIIGQNFDRSNSRHWRDNGVMFHYEGKGRALIVKGAKQKIRGKRKGVRRFTFISVDDFEGEENTKTPEAMYANLKWLLGAARFSLDKRRGRIAMVSTPQNSGCACMKLENPQSGWVSLTFPCILGFRTKNEIALWPEVQTLDMLHAEYAENKAIGMGSVWMREKMVRPSSGDDSLFPVEKFRYHRGELFHQDGLAYYRLTHLGAQGETNPPELVDQDRKPQPKILPVNTYLGVDPAAGESKRASRTAIVPGAMDAQKNKIVLPYYAHRLHPAKIFGQIEVMHRRVKPENVRIEKVAFQVLLASIGRQLYPHWHVREGDQPYPERLTEDVHRGKVWLPAGGGLVDGQPGQQVLRQEFEDFPFGKKDLVMATYLAFFKAYSPGHEWRGASERRNDQFKYSDYEDFMTVG